MDCRQVVPSIIIISLPVAAWLFSGQKGGRVIEHWEPLVNPSCGRFNIISLSQFILSSAGSPVLV
jgi:hypothetical protein